MDRFRDPFVWPVRVYYEDTDSGGVVYYANYLKFMERARSEWLRIRGFESEQLMREHRLLFPVVRVTVEYLRPARLDELLQVRVRMIRCGRASLEFGQTICHGLPEGALLCRRRVKVACVDAITLRPRPIPLFIATELVREREPIAR